MRLFLLLYFFWLPNYSGASPSKRLVQRIEAYGLPLTAHTKIPIDTVTVFFVSHLFDVKNTNKFLAKIDRAASTKDSVAFSQFRQDFVRMGYKIIFEDGTYRSIFIDKGGKYMLINKRVYLLRGNKPLTRAIANAIPRGTDQILDKEEKRTYKKSDYLPYKYSKPQTLK